MTKSEKGVGGPLVQQPLSQQQLNRLLSSPISNRVPPSEQLPEVFVNGKSIGQVTSFDIEYKTNSGDPIQVTCSIEAKEAVPVVSQRPMPQSSPELDRFITALLRAVGGTIVIDPMDSVIGSDEHVELTQLPNGCYKYALITDDPNPTQPPPEPDDTGTEKHPIQPLESKPPIPTHGATWRDPKTGITWTGRVDPVGWTHMERTKDPVSERTVWMPRERWDPNW